MNVKNLGPSRYCFLLHGVTSVTHKNTAEARECHLEMSYETNTLASISGLLCLSEMAGSGEGLTRAAQWRGLVGRDRPLPQPHEPSKSRACPPPTPTPQADQRVVALEKP